MFNLYCTLQGNQMCDMMNDVLLSFQSSYISYNSIFFSVHFFQSSEIFPSWTFQVQHWRGARPFLSHLSAGSSGSCAIGKRSCQSADQDACEEQEAEGTSEMKTKSSKSQPTLQDLGQINIFIEYSRRWGTELKCFVFAGVMLFWSCLTYAVVLGDYCSGPPVCHITIYR